MAKCEVCGNELVCPVCSNQGEIETPKGHVIWLDIYQGNSEHNFVELAKNKVKGICGKVGYGWTYNKMSGSEKDKKFIENYKKVTDAGMEYAGYWWTHPQEDWNRQVNVCLEQIDGMKLSFFAVDMEQSHGYVQVLDKKKKKYITKLGQISSAQISGANEYIASEISKKTNIPVFIYTRNSFITEYSPQTLNWMKYYPYWICQPPKESVITYIKREADEKGYIWCPTWDEWYEKYALDPETSKVALPRGIDEWKIWQFSIDRVKLPGSNSYMDINWLKL